MQFIDLKAQYTAYKSEIDEAIRGVFAHGQFIMGPEVGQLEEELAQFVGVKHCVSTASGTESLELGLRALGIGPGDEVITVPFTFISTAEAIELVGAKTVFVDIEYDTFNMDMSLVRDAITERTKAIIPVSLFGQMADLEQANRLATEFGLSVIEDGAQSFGATLNGKRSCSMTTLGSTSFFPAKPLGCYGEGGALFTNDDDLAEKLRLLRNHGSCERDHHIELGTNGRFDTIQAATLLAKLPHFTDELRERERIAIKYSRNLNKEFKPPRPKDERTHVYGQYTVRTRDREKLRTELCEKGIPTGVYYSKCVHRQPAFQRRLGELGSFPRAEGAAKEVVSFPMHAFLSDEDQDTIIQAANISLTEMQ